MNVNNVEALEALISEWSNQHLDGRVTLGAFLASRGVLVPSALRASDWLNIVLDGTEGSVADLVFHLHPAVAEMERIAKGES